MELWIFIQQGDLGAANLEDVYRILNLEHPKDYEARSLSVSDIVEVVASTRVEPGFYFCDGVGFQKVDCDPEQVGKVQNTMQVVMLEPGKEARITEFGTSFEAMQRVVAGDMEAIYPFEEEVALIYNDEGKNNGMGRLRSRDHLAQREAKGGKAHCQSLQGFYPKE